MVVEGGVESSALLTRYWRAARDELVQASLLQFDGQFYSIHPQIRHFALSHLPSSERNRVHRVVAAYYYSLPAPTADEWLEAFEHLEVAGEVQDLQEAICVALNATQALEGSGSLQRLLAILRRAHGYATRLGDDANNSLLNSRLGGILRLLGQYTEAEVYLKSSQAFEVQRQNRQQEGWIQYELALLYSDQGDHQHAVAYIEQALVVFKEVKEERGIALAEIAFADICRGLARYKEALRHVELALLNCYQCHDQPAQARAICMRGTIYESLGQYSRAIRDYEEAHRHFHDLKRIVDEAWVQLYKCSVYRRQGKLDQAEKICQEILLLFQQEQLIPAEVRVAHLRGDVCVAKGEPGNARSLYEQALALSTRLGNYVEQAAIYNALGALSLTEDDYLEANELYEQSVSIVREYGARNLYGQALLGLGNVAYAMQRFVDAEQYYHEGEALFEEIDTPVERGTVLNQMGMLYLAQHKYREARGAWEKALALDYYLPMAQRQVLSEKISVLVAEHRLDGEFPISPE
jgi:tetratricopeptide (TPR) repeat protein